MACLLHDVLDYDQLSLLIPIVCPSTQVGGKANNTEGGLVFLQGDSNVWEGMKHGEWQTMKCSGAGDPKHPTGQGPDRWRWTGEVRRQCLYGVMQKILGACTPVNCDGTEGEQVGGWVG